MPLTPGSGQAVISKNIETEKHAHPDMPIKQAAAIAYSSAGESKQGKDGEFEESKHPRGQPGNAGEFASGTSVTHKATGKTGKVINSEYGGKSVNVQWDRGTPPQAVHRDNLKATNVSTAHKAGGGETYGPPEKYAGYEKPELFGSTPPAQQSSGYKDMKDVYGPNTNFKSTAEKTLSPEEQAMAKKSGGEFANKNAQTQTPRVTQKTPHVKVLSVPEQHQLRIARETFKNPMKGKFLGGPTAEESREIIKRLTGKDPGEPAKDKEISPDIVRDAQPSMVTQPNSGGPAWKGKNLDDNPVGDSYGSADCAAVDCGWPGRVL